MLLKPYSFGIFWIPTDTDFQREYNGYIFVGKKVEMRTVEILWFSQIDLF